MSRIIVLLLLMLFSAQLTFAQIAVSNPLPAIDSQWIQHVLDNWDRVCRQELNISVEPLPWIILYDSTAAWHVNPNRSLLPRHEPTNYRFTFNHRPVTVVRMPQRMTVWVPDRPPVPMGSLPVAAMPYAKNSKSFFIAPLPSLFHVMAPASEAVYLDFLFTGNNMHELTHTRQLPYVVRQLLQIQRDYKLPESIDDNSIQALFSKNDAYVERFLIEKSLLWKAVFTKDKDSCKEYARQALATAGSRKKDFFTGQYAGYDPLDDIFLSLEGSAMWAQYRLMLANAPQGMRQDAVLDWLLQRSASWSQEEGLAIFLLIDRLSPGWQQYFFGKALPGAFPYLRRAVDAKEE